MPKNKLRDSILFFLLITLSASASFYSLTGKPPVWFDEGIFLHTGRVLADEGRFGVQLTPGQFTDDLFYFWICLVLFFVGKKNVQHQYCIGKHIFTRLVCPSLWCWQISYR